MDRSFRQTRLKKALFTTLLFDNSLLLPREENLEKISQEAKERDPRGHILENHIAESEKKVRYGHCFHNSCGFHVPKRRFYPYSVS